MVDLQKKLVYALETSPEFLQRLSEGHMHFNAQSIYDEVCKLNECIMMLVKVLCVHMDLQA